jgi:hypothetical protein
MAWSVLQSVGANTGDCEGGADTFGPDAANITVTTDGAGFCRISGLPDGANIQVRQGAFNDPPLVVTAQPPPSGIGFVVSMYMPNGERWFGTFDWIAIPWH